MLRLKIKNKRLESDNTGRRMSLLRQYEISTWHRFRRGFLNLNPQGYNMVLRKLIKRYGRKRVDAHLDQIAHILARKYAQIYNEFVSKEMEEMRMREAK